MGLGQRFSFAFERDEKPVALRVTTRRCPINSSDGEADGVQLEPIIYIERQ